MIKLVKLIFSIPLFYFIKSRNKLKLSFSKNWKEAFVLKEIFINREYADYFPFYKNNTIIDLGSHYGFFSLFASMNSAKGSKVIALEPSTHTFKILDKNIKDCADGNDIKTYNLGIWHKEEKLKLYKSKDSQQSVFSKKAEGEFEYINLIPLKQLMDKENIQKINFLKIDVEGAEYELLFNLTSEQFNMIEVISLEFHDRKEAGKTGQDIVTLLEKNGFKIKTFRHSMTMKNLNFGKIIATK